MSVFDKRFPPPRFICAQIPALQVGADLSQSMNYAVAEQGLEAMLGWSRGVRAPSTLHPSSDMRCGSTPVNKTSSSWSLMTSAMQRTFVEEALQVVLIYTFCCVVGFCMLKTKCPLTAVASQERPERRQHAGFGREESPAESWKWIYLTWQRLLGLIRAAVLEQAYWHWMWQHWEFDLFDVSPLLTLCPSAALVCQ